VRDWFPVKNSKVSSNLGMVYIELRLNKAPSAIGQYKDVTMLEQIVRDKLNEVHKRAKVIQQPD